MSQPKVTIIIVTRNSKMFMPSCLDSILHQTYRDFQIVVVDNDSADGTVDFIRREFPMVGVIENNKNLGFARANNHGIQLSKSPWVLLCNPDVVLEPDWLEKIMAVAESAEGQDYGVFGGKLLKIKLLDPEIFETEKTTVIDSCGLKVLKNRRFVELGAGEDSAKFKEHQEVFGHSGALVMLRRDILDRIALKDPYHGESEYFDSTFFLYQEDVDFAWRLRLAGIRALLAPEAIAYHMRSTSGSEHQGNLEIAGNRKQQSSVARYYSYRNHLLLLLTDEQTRNFWRYFWPIIWLEGRKLAYLVMFEQKNLKAWAEVIKLWPEIRAKRRFVQRSAKLSAKDLRQWFQ